MFDPGCRPAEAALYLAGGHVFHPAPYKWMLFLLCAAAPVVFAWAGRNCGLSPAGAVLAGGCGAALWWASPVQEMLKAGQVDALLAGLAALAALGGLARYALAPGPTAWLTVTLAATLGWYAHPVAWLGTLPVFAAYYFANAPRHGLAWHLGFFAALPVGLAPNLGWLTDWGRFWWLRQPLADATPWPAWRELIGFPDRYAELLAPGTAGGTLALVGLLGLALMAKRGMAATALVLAVAAVCAATAARVGTVWPPARAASLDRAVMLLPALAAIPAAYLVSELLKRWGIAAALAVIVAALPGLMAKFPERAPAWGRPAVEPFQLNLTSGQEQLLQLLKHRTGPAARILLEDGNSAHPGWNWTALLPVLTERTFIGGLDPEGGIEHLTCGLRDGKLLNRPFEEWTAADRTAYCVRYNIGWVVCRSESAARFWAADPAAREMARFDDGGEVVCFELDRIHSFIRSGTAIVERADRERVVLRDLVPDEQGYVRLSFHFQAEMRAAPLTAVAEADPDQTDPVPLLRIHLPGPMSRVTLRWQQP